MSLSAIYILVALGFTLLFGIMRVVNFAHGEFAMLGAFALFYLMKTLQWHWVFALPIGVIGVATASLVLEWLVFRWFYHRMFESMIGLLGLNMMMMFGAVQLWDVHERNIPSMSGDVLMLGDIIIPVDRLIVVIIAVTSLSATRAPALPCAPPRRTSRPPRRRASTHGAPTRSPSSSPSCSRRSPVPCGARSTPCLPYSGSGRC